jgi:farnesyl-diphosphate farnesyltransferase
VSSPSKPLSATFLETRAFDVLLRRCARSFQLSLRVLPASVRPTLSLAYMLARGSDTIADASTAPEFQRLALLRALPDSFPEKCPELDLSGADRELMNVFPHFSPHWNHCRIPKK